MFLFSRFATGDQLQELVTMENFLWFFFPKRFIVHRFHQMPNKKFSRQKHPTKCTPRFFFEVCREFETAKRTMSEFHFSLESLRKAVSGQRFKVEKCYLNKRKKTKSPFLF